MTERFTGKISDRNMVSNGIYGMIGKCGRYFVGEAIDKLTEYETAEEERRLVVLTCDTVYFIWNKSSGISHVRAKSILDLSLREILGIDKDGKYWSVKEEAEKALKENEGNADRRVLEYYDEVAMQELEKILEEIEKLKDMYEESAFSLIDKGDLPCEYDKSDIESAKMQAISEAITIIRNHMNDGWIPVEERLPEDTESGFYNAVSVTMSNGSVTHGCYRNADGEWWVAMEDGEFKYTRSDEVIAWCPLPEPYQPGKER